MSPGPSSFQKRVSLSENGLKYFIRIYDCFIDSIGFTLSDKSLQSRIISYGHIHLETIEHLVEFGINPYG
jgi:hypothetical protein